MSVIAVIGLRLIDYRIQRPQHVIITLKLDFNMKNVFYPLKTASCIFIDDYVIAEGN